MERPASLAKDTKLLPAFRTRASKSPFKVVRARASEPTICRVSLPETPSKVRSDNAANEVWSKSLPPPPDTVSVPAKALASI